MLICLHTCIYMLDIFFFQKAMDLVDIIKKIMDPVGHLGVHGPEWPSHNSLGSSGHFKSCANSATCGVFYSYINEMN
jgi:hypothetical protein